MPHDDAAGNSKLPAATAWPRHAHSAKSVVEQNGHAGAPESTLRALIEENVLTQFRNLKTHPCVAGALSPAKLHLHGWIHEIATGQIQALDRSVGRFVPLVREEAVRAQPQAQGGHDPTRSRARKDREGFERARLRQSAPPSPR